MNAVHLPRILLHFDYHLMFLFFFFIGASFWMLCVSSSLMISRMLILKKILALNKHYNFTFEMLLC